MIEVRFGGSGKLDRVCTASVWQSQDEKQGHSDPKVSNLMYNTGYTQRKYTGSDLRWSRPAAA